MNRRSFFKVLGATAAAISVPSVVLAPFSRSAQAASSAEILGFLAGKEYGMAVTLPGSWEKYAEWATEWLIEDARKHLPKGTTFQIRVCHPTDFGFRQGAAWYTNEKIALAEPTGPKDPQVKGFIQLTCTLIPKAFPVAHNTLDLQGQSEYSAVMGSTIPPRLGDRGRRVK